MADIPKPSAPKPPPVAPVKPDEFKFNKDVLDKRLNDIVTYQEQFAGKPNHNPFIWIKKNVTPLRDRLLGFNPDGSRTTPETSKELHDAIMALPMEEVPAISKPK